MNLAALSLNNRDYMTAEENFRAVLKLQPKNFEAAIGLGVALRGNKKIDEAEAQYNAAQGARSVAGRQLLQPRSALPGVQGRPEAVAAEGAGVLPAVPRPRLGRHLRLAQEGGREAHQGHRRNLRRPRRGGEDAGRVRGDAEEGRRAAEADGRADEEAGGRGEGSAEADKAAADAKKAGGDKGAARPPRAATRPRARVPPRLAMPPRRRGRSCRRRAAAAAGKKGGKKKK